MRKALALVALAGFSWLASVGCGSDPPTSVGSPCTDPSGCDGGICLQNGFSDGYCSQSCTSGDPSTCPDGSSCVDDGAGAPTGVTSLCYLICVSNDECRSGYVCSELVDHHVCHPGP